MGRINYDQAFGDWPLVFGVGLGITLIAGLLIFPWIYRRYLTIGYWRAFGFSAIVLAAAYLVEFHHAATRQPYWRAWYENPFFFFQNCLSPGLMILFAAPFFLMLYRKWIHRKTSEAERAPGWEGFRAWICFSNLFCVLGAAYFYTASYSFWNWNDGLLAEPYEFFGKLAAGGVGLLLVYPLLITLSHYRSIYQNRETRGQDKAAVQNKILTMLESGRISPQECAELLAAVYRSKEAGGRPGKPEQWPAESTPPPFSPEPPADSAAGVKIPPAPLDKVGDGGGAPNPGMNSETPS
ncbi:MAG: hypothetical protein JXR73_06910 [Candidatus Omnitrophica bacterium]|nr:hypothetical protein [Candidatus Omnitrophota bacterium]